MCVEWAVWGVIQIPWFNNAKSTVFANVQVWVSTALAGAILAAIHTYDANA